MNDSTTPDVVKEEPNSTWTDSIGTTMKSIKMDLGVNNQIYQVLSTLFEKAKEQEEKFKKQTNELGTIKKDSEEAVGNLKGETKEYREKIKKELDLWRIITMGVVIVTAIGFITLILDTFWRRNDDFHKMNLEYNDKVNSLEDKSDIIEFEKEQLDKKIGEQQTIIENFKKQQDCLSGKKYWEYEQCFK